MSVQEEKLRAIADAIRAKDGTTDPIPAGDFPARIAAIETGVDTSDADATAADIAKDKTAYVNGEKVTGNVLTFESGVSVVFLDVNYVSTSTVDGVKNLYVNQKFSGNKLFRDNSGVSLYIPMTDAQFGDAAAVDVAAGKTFTSASGRKVAGTGIRRWVTNDDSITPTGTYANSTYYNTTFGVLVSYAPNGDVVLTMKGGTTTAYEDLNFTLASAPSGVTLDFVLNTGTSSTSARLYSCVLHGITQEVTIQIAMNSVNATYDWTQCAVTVTAV